MEETDRIVTRAQNKLRVRNHPERGLLSLASLLLTALPPAVRSGLQALQLRRLSPGIVAWGRRQ